MFVNNARKVLWKYSHFPSKMRLRHIFAGRTILQYTAKDSRTKPIAFPLHPSTKTKREKRQKVILNSKKKRWIMYL